MGTRSLAWCANWCDSFNEMRLYQRGRDPVVATDRGAGAGGRGDREVPTGKSPRNRRGAVDGVGARTGPVERTQQPVLGVGALDRDLPGAARPDQHVHARAIAVGAPARAGAARVTGGSLAAGRREVGEGGIGHGARSELAGAAAGGGAASHGAVAGREARLVDELESHGLGQKRASIQADAAAGVSGSVPSVEVVEPGV